MFKPDVFLFLSISGGEIFVVLLFILLFFGADKIPGFARTMGRTIRQIKDATDDIQRDIQDSAKSVKRDFQNSTKEVKDQVKSLTDPKDQPE